MNDLNKFLDIVKSTQVLEKEKSSLLSKEELKLLLESHKGILSKEIIEYLNSLIELEFSVIKDNIDLNNREILTELSIYRYVSIYNIYNRSIKLIKAQKLPIDINRFDKPIDVCEDSLNLSFVTRNKKRINVFEYDYNYHSPYKNKIPEYYYNRNLGEITIYQTIESKERKEEEINLILEKLERLYDKEVPIKNKILIEEYLMGCPLPIENKLEIGLLEKRFTELDSIKELTKEKRKEIEITNYVAKIILDDMGLTEDDFIEDTYDLFNFSKEFTNLEETRVKKLTNLEIKRKIKYI